MAYSEQLAERVREHIYQHEGVDEKKMFGGLCFTIHGNMCCGPCDDELMLRLTKELAEEALKSPQIREMDFTGKPMKSMVFVKKEGLEKDEDLAKWVNLAIEHCKTLPPKGFKK